MSFGDAIRSCFIRYLVFEGRARRREYWYFAVFVAVISTVLLILATATKSSVWIGLLLLWEVGSFFPLVSALVRRLHDIDKSGWWYWISLVPLIGQIWLLVLLLTDSTKGTNSYGPSPKYV